jgi:branched-chain amino acid transport system substrate-binding protein
MTTASTSAGGDDMTTRATTARWTSGVARAGLAACLLAGSPALAQTPPTVKLGVVTFLSGPAAGAFGIPARNAAELVLEAVNAGTIPAPYNTKGLGGAQIEPIFVDENGPTSKVVQDYRDLVQRREAGVVIGYVSSGSCLAVAPVAEELKTLTVFFDCGTPRIFEDASYQYVFRPAATATIDSVGAARYVLAKFPDIKTYGGINQNYAWGQDSWRDFTNSLKVLKPGLTVTQELFPKLFAGQFSAEISTLLASNSDLVHSSFYAGDLESFILQATPRGLMEKSHFVMTTAESAMYRMGPRMPDGVVMGARGPYGVYAKDTELNRWFRQAFTERYGVPPVYPSYQMANSIVATKAAFDKAMQAKPKPATTDVIKAFEHQEFEGFGSTVKMALGKGHQAITDIGYGTYKYDKETGTPTITDIVVYPAECVNPPEGVKSDDWIKGGMKGAKCP